MLPRRRCRCNRQRVPRRRARVGGLCGFRSPTERVPTGSPKAGHCTAVRKHCGHGKRRKRTAAGEFQQREKPQAAKQEKRLGAFLRQPVHFCPQCGQFRGMKMALFCGCQKWNGAVISKKPKKASKIKEHFDAIPISGGFGHENRRTKPSYSLDGRCCMVAGAGTLQKRRMQHAKRIHCKGDSVLLRLFAERVRRRLPAENPRRNAGSHSQYVR